MKKLTNESKARFFAQNVGTRFCTDFSNSEYLIINGATILNIQTENDLFKTAKAILIPLQNISDEHKVWCMHRANEHIGYDQTQDYGTNIEMVNHLIENEGLKSICFLYSQYQYLQSKGYALDYYCPIENRIIPVQEQIDNGWITLKTE